MLTTLISYQLSGFPDVYKLIGIFSMLAHDHNEHLHNIYKVVAKHFLTEKHFLTFNLEEKNVFWISIGPLFFTVLTST